MIINANPISRSKVEKGEYCIRENENNVDINRNYDAHWTEVKNKYINYLFLLRAMINKGKLILELNHFQNLKLEQ